MFRPADLIGVIDLQRGVAVRGVAGQRHLYQPLRSRLVDSADPRRVAAAYRGLGINAIYLADLDAIGGSEPALELYAELLDDGCELLVDAGVTSTPRGLQLGRFDSSGRPLQGMIVGSESLRSSACLGELIAELSPERLWFSLDLRQGQVITAAEEWNDRTASDVAAAAYSAGVRRMIVLDVAAVGTGRGVPTVPLIRELRARHSELKLVSGGGIRNAADVQELLGAGCDRVLVASAIHDGRLLRDVNRDDLLFRSESQL